ncbi:MAG: hypothetical protein RIK87_20340 [Fuerstiella sp.]
MKRLLLITLTAGGAALFAAAGVADAACGCRQVYSPRGYSYHAPSTAYSASYYGSGIGYSSSRLSGRYYSPGISLRFNRGFGGYHGSHLHHYGRWGGGPGSANFHRHYYH